MIIIKILIATLMLCVSFALIALSGFMNYKYGLTLGNSPQNAQIYGALAVAFDIFKALLPLVIVILWRQKNILFFAIASIGFAGLMIFSLSSGFGFSMKNRTATSQTAELLKEKRADLRKDLKLKRQEKAKLPDHRPVDTVKSALEAARQNRRWSSSDQCTNATAAKSRTFCTKYNNLKAEYATAKTAALIASQITDIQKALTKFSTRKTQMTGDVQAAALSSYFGISQTSAQTNMSIFLSILSEFGSSFGLIFTAFYWKAKPINDKKPSRKKPAPKTQKQKPVVKSVKITVDPEKKPIKALPAPEPVKPIQPDPEPVIKPPSTPTETILSLEPPQKPDRKTQLSDFINDPGQTVKLEQQIEPANQSQHHDFGLADFIKQTLIKQPKEKVQIKPLFRRFNIWCKTHHIEPLSQKDFIEDMNILLEQEPIKGSYQNIKLVA